jgi:MFS transporter, SP family, sugar:H+ symporter
VAALIVIFCALYVISFAFGWGPVGWIVPAEIFPLELRGKGESILRSS